MPHGYLSLPGGTCYPEGRIERRDLERTSMIWQLRGHAGVDFVSTQQFCGSADYLSFMELFDRGAPTAHFCTLNEPSATRAVSGRLRE